MKQGKQEVKKIDIPISALVSILVGVISLWVFLANGFKIISYFHPLDLAYLSEQNIKIDRYVKGTISDCVTVPLFNNQNTLSGSSGMLVEIVGRDYESYTVPIFGDQYIRVWINNEESLKGMESIVHGDKAEVSFVGQIKKGGPLNTEWYNWNPELDQSKIVADYVIWQKTLDVEKNFCIAGFYGMVIAVLIYYFCGRIQIIEVQPETKKRSKVGYDKENQLVISRKRLEMYEELERIYRKKRNIGTICIIIGFIIAFILELYELKAIGLLLMLYGSKKWWNFFINSKNRCAIEVARIFSMKTLQTKRAVEECKIEMIEKESLTEM